MARAPPVAAKRGDEMWYRVFGTNDHESEPVALLEHLRDIDERVTGHFKGDEHGWTRAEIVFAENATPLYLERFLAKVDDIRDDLNAWAAWLETMDHQSNHGRLMQHVIQTMQLFTLRWPRECTEGPVSKHCLAICRFLARQTAGVYQVDTQGFFAADGTLLLPEG